MKHAALLNRQHLLKLLPLYTDDQCGNMPHGQIPLFPQFFDHKQPVRIGFKGRKQRGSVCFPAFLIQNVCLFGIEAEKGFRHLDTYSAPGVDQVGTGDHAVLKNRNNRRRDKIQMPVLGRQAKIGIHRIQIVAGCFLNVIHGHNIVCCIPDLVDFIIDRRGINGQKVCSLRVKYREVLFLEGMHHKKTDREREQKDQKKNHADLTNQCPVTHMHAQHLPCIRLSGRTLQCPPRYSAV